MANSPYLLPPPYSLTATLEFERMPEIVNRCKTFLYVTPCNSNSLASVPSQGSYPELNSPVGSISSGKFLTTGLPPASQAILTYNDVDITTPNLIIINYNPSLSGIRHTSLATTTSFKYATVDAAGKQDPTPATYTVNLASLRLLNGLSLSATQQGSSVKLTCDATSEHNVLRYELEYSTNTTNFTPLTSFTYHTITSNTNTYTYTHLPSVSNGIIFYRVIQYRADGTISISNQVSVRLTEKNIPFATVMPTLITDMANVSIHNNTTGKTVLNLFDNSEKVLNKKELYLPAGNTTFTVGWWTLLASKTYYIHIKRLILKQS